MNAPTNAVEQVFAGLFGKLAQPTLKLVKKDGSQFTCVHKRHEEPYSVVPMVGIYAAEHTLVLNARHECSLADEFLYVIY